MSEVSLHPDQAVVFDVQRFSVHDGPGIRTVVFFKGCHLACVWCQNPEGKRHAPELAYHVDRCVPTCRACVDSCPEGAIVDRVQDRVDWAKCTHCGKCADVCPSTALSMVGSLWSAEDLLTEVMADRSFYAVSGGGLTLSGGEPVLASRFLQEFLPKAKQAGLHVTLETSGQYPHSLLEPLLPFLDLIYFDVKAGGRDLHLRLVGQPCDDIDDNLRRLLAVAEQGGPQVEVRMPVVPGYNDGADSLVALGERLRALGVSRLSLLPYNHLWEAKLAYLDSSKQPLGLRVEGGGVYQRVIADLADQGLQAAMAD